uniref:UFSP1/2/DUB catalytic domain-containing protein n=1 Tax=Compsopogon caeruleus TaxID=31354 RepID=A0A6T6CU71_9RHOD|mmetsp:Transcript_4748/g.9597  ORF Transcript_4748/g.9597 Transcript_4748/m.9597 type:complete len:351 (+) Transcript_4748:187-1239(+)|eukprot:CAMPEP_0184679094 /NCGR_PEP_ID=MMETSP0312-20130426/1919_1 /TAXON_ID=31354 /ORGANISM="Compsopogon coeruleus, Strain SAG 36.94" /LENGTH=350 /DNA_ID=CAMNT_0027128321 /DNA_START=77 /DNA_END=1129 /DNA_ORIENTATION=-
MSQECPVCLRVIGDGSSEILQAHVEAHFAENEDINGVVVDGGALFEEQTLRGGLADAAEEVTLKVMTKVFSAYRHGSGSGSGAGRRNPAGLRKVHLASEVDHYSTSSWGHGWDCGYKNLQTMLSALFNSQRVASALRQAGVHDVPPLPALQHLIEQAWQMGFDVENARQMGSNLQGETTWIGACEVAAVLRSLGVRAGIVDFETPDRASRESMVTWIYNYFAERCGAKAIIPGISSKLGKCGYCRGGTWKEMIPPLFLQYPGHSITVVGAEKYADGSKAILILDVTKQALFKLQHMLLTDCRLSVGSAGLLQPRFQIVYIGQNALYETAEEVEAAKLVISEPAIVGTRRR